METCYPIGPVGKSVGTRIEVKDIFASVPARMAFQRSPSTESAAIVDVVLAYALAHPEVGFSIRVDGRDSTFITRPYSSESRLYDVLGGSSERLILLSLPTQMNLLLVTKDGEDGFHLHQLTVGELMIFIFLLTIEQLLLLLFYNQSEKDIKHV